MDVRLVFTPAPDTASPMRVMLPLRLLALVPLMVIELAAPAGRKAIPLLAPVAMPYMVRLEPLLTLMLDAIPLPSCKPMPLPDDFPLIVRCPPLTLTLDCTKSPALAWCEPMVTLPFVLIVTPPPKPNRMPLALWAPDAMVVVAKPVVLRLIVLPDDAKTPPKLPPEPSIRLSPVDELNVAVPPLKRIPEASGAAAARMVYLPAVTPLEPLMVMASHPGALAVASIRTSPSPASMTLLSTTEPDAFDKAFPRAKMSTSRLPVDVVSAAACPMRAWIKMRLLASSVSLALLAPDLTIAALTLMLPSLSPLEPSKPVATVTLVPALRLAAMSLARMVEVALGEYCVPGVPASLSPYAMPLGPVAAMVMLLGSSNQSLAITRVPVVCRNSPEVSTKPPWDSSDAPLALPTAAKMLVS